MTKIISKNLDTKEKAWTFLDGSKRTAVVLGSVIIGRGSYFPGWKWSEHVGKQTGKTSQAHTGYIISGSMVIRDADGHEAAVGPGEAFETGPGHDAWVVGNETCVALDFEQLK